MNNLGVYYTNTKQYAKGIECLQKSLNENLNKPKLNKKAIASNYLKLAHLSTFLNDLQNAKKYALLSYKMRSEIGDKKGIVLVLNMLSLNKSIGKDEQIAYLKEGIQIMEELKYTEFLQSFCFNTATYYHEAGNYDSGLVYYKKAKSIQAEMKGHYSKRDNLAAAFGAALKYNIVEAHDLLEMIDSFAENSSLTSFHRKNYFDAIKQFDSAYYYAEMYRETTDSMQRVEMNTLSEQLKDEYELERVNNRVQVLNKESEIQQLALTNNKIKITQQVLENLKQKQSLLIKNLEIQNKDKSLAISKTEQEKQNQELLIVNKDIELKQNELKYLQQEKQNQVLLANQKLEKQKNIQIQERKNLLGGFTILSLITLLGFAFYRNSHKQKIQKEKFEITLRTQEDERNRIAAEMHDDLGTGLTSIKMLSELAKYKEGKGVRGNELEKISENINKLVETMADIVWAMNSKNDTLQSLLLYTKNYANEYLHENDLNVQFDFQIPMEYIEIKGQVRRNIFLVCKESLHNIVKHAKADSVKMMATYTNNQLRISIYDNGVGIDINSIREFANGLKNMESRMKSIQGSYTIENKEGTQTDLAITMTYDT